MKMTILMFSFSIFAYAATAANSYPRPIGMPTLEQCKFFNPSKECEQDPRTNWYHPKCNDGYEPAGSLCTEKITPSADEYFQTPFADLNACTRLWPTGCEQSGMLYYPKCREGYTPYRSSTTAMCKRP
jgi:hypothetical protein